MNAPKLASIPALIVALLGCDQKTLAPWKGVTRIEISHNSKIVRTISDAQQIERIAAFVNSRLDHWGSPWYGVPVPTDVADFYERDKFLGHFGAGEGFFEAHQNGDFWSRKASKSETEAFLKSIGE